MSWPYARQVTRVRTKASAQCVPTPNLHHCDPLTWFYGHIIIKTIVLECQCCANPGSNYSTDMILLGLNISFLGTRNFDVRFLYVETKALRDYYLPKVT